MYNDLHLIFVWVFLTKISLRISLKSWMLRPMPSSIPSWMKACRPKFTVSDVTCDVWQVPQRPPRYPKQQHLTLHRARFGDRKSLGSWSSRSSCFLFHLSRMIPLENRLFFVGGWFHFQRCQPFLNCMQVEHSGTMEMGWTSYLSCFFR